ncbi:hypothetical protein QBC43DRAFT_316218 [Cladorrhinum sp. PSN259]|nr:hypothetical protein QBC43DRAFT_316218 [Cladorrhinum sp. PSN259]
MVLDEKIPASAHNGRGLKHDEPSRVTKESGIHPDRLMILDDYKRLPAAPGKDQLSPKPESPSDLSFLTGSNRMILERSIQKPTSGTRKNLQKPLEMEDKQNLNFLTGSNRMIFDGNRPSSDPPLRAKNKNVDDDNGHQVKKPRVDDRVCGLCGGDHFLPKDCPAKMDPRDGSAPHKTYKCGICQVVGGHYTVDCPQKKGSRLEATAKHDRPSAPFVKAHLEDQRSVLRGGHSDPSLWSASARKDRHPPSSRRELIERSRGDSYRPAKDGHNHGTMSINGPPSTWEASLSRDWDTLSPNARSQENDHERNMKRVKKVEFAADLVVHSESRNDGRLSYHDEDDDTQVPLPASVKTRKARRRAREIGATLLTTPDGRHPIAEIQAHQLEDMITDMIAQESARALEAITQPPVEPANSGGIDVSQTPERDPRWDPFVLQLFKNKQIEWAFRKERPRAVNFFDLVAEVKEKLLEEPKEKGSIDGTMEVNYHQQDFTIPAPVKGTESFQDMEKVMKAEQSDEAVVDTAMDLTGVPCLEKSQIAQMSMMGSTVDSLVEYSQPTEMVASGEGEQETEAFVIDTGTDSVTVSPPAVTMGVEMPPAPAVNQEVDKINLIQTVNDSNMDFDHLPSPVPQQNSDGISTDQDGDAVMDLNDGSATAECDSAVGGS